MNPTDISLVSLAIVLFLSASYIPTSFYKSAFVSSFGPFIVLTLLIVSTSFSRVGAIFLILAVASLFVEYRKRVLDTVAGEISYEKQMEAAPPVVPTEIHPAPEMPSEDLVGYKPTGNATDEFEAVDMTINRKEVLPTSRLPEQAEKFLIDHGLAENQY